VLDYTPEPHGVTDINSVQSYAADDLIEKRRSDVIATLEYVVVFGSGGISRFFFVSAPPSLRGQS
jgi:hypothetical protein